MPNPTPFTPEEVAQILEAFFAAVGTRQYIGARYMPIFGRKGEESILWDNSAPYESLTIVLYQGNSYTSRQYVPEGVEITNEEFWAETGNYNAQIEQYRNEVLEIEQKFDDYKDSLDELFSNIKSSIPSYDVIMDGYSLTCNSLVTALRLKRDEYAMNAFIPYSEMTPETAIYQDIFSKFTGTVFCAPCLASDYYIRDSVYKVTHTNQWCLLCVDNDENYSFIECYENLPSAQTLIENGIKNAIWVWEPIIVNGLNYDVNRIPETATSREGIITDKQPRTIIGWDDEYIYLIVINGRIPYGEGATHYEMASLMTELGIRNAMNCDGGGSTQLWTAPDAHNLAYIRDPHTGSIPLQSRAKPMTGFSPIE